MMTKRQVMWRQLGVLLIVLLIWLGCSWGLYHGSILVEVSNDDTTWNLALFGLAAPWVLMIIEGFWGLKRRQWWLLLAGILVGVTEWLRGYQKENPSFMMLVVPIALLMCWVQTQVIMARWLPDASLKRAWRWLTGLLVGLVLASGIVRFSPIATMRVYLAGYSNPVTAMATHLFFDRQPHALTNRNSRYTMTTESPEVMTASGELFDGFEASGIESGLIQHGYWFKATGYPWWEDEDSEGD
ncbi:hypothetical protein MUDAN_DOGOELCO_02452 [Lactiplantibacillus mudanjiangensis]|nr:hypothetical protein MUDAN_DOGOELCO_02452 [Lactiplantibacillus mudanjiangensis]